jgi:radical SAM superfamily enzyme YgiQ (UPF0313 family)
MKSHPVVFITISDYDNLGVGYMASVLSEAGFETKVIDPRKKKSCILKTLKTIDPLLVGFSIIFLNHIDLFVDLIDYLRKGGINCHFTAGGHYASLKYEELFQIIPRLDSIVRFEGEYPILELAKCIDTSADWRKIDSIAFKEKNKIITNPVWPPEIDLDKFPFPSRSPLKKYAFKKKFTTILAGRGCVHNCSFCNTREFYRQASGPVKRIRKPEAVVSEIESLFYHKDCSVFLFHDDDFPVKSTMQRDWLVRFCKGLERTSLNKKVIWKINCRPDEIEEETFSMMKRNGLFLIFLGIEDGTDAGLKRLNKNMTVPKTLNSVNILKKLKIGFDYGFILFQPQTTYKSLNVNLDFLRQICGDGYTPVSFLKLVPLYATRVEKELIKAGRLNVANGIGDYEFLEKSMNQYYNFVMDCFDEWMRDPYGVENVSKWARNYFSVYLHYFGNSNDVKKLNHKFIKIISESNLFLLDTMKELSVIFQSGKYLKDDNHLESYRKRINSKHESFKDRIYNNMDLLLLHAPAYQ